MLRLAMTLPSRPMPSRRLTSLDAQPLQTGARPPAFDNPNDSRGRRSASVAKEKRDDSYILA
jgi:hypothetical protein